jgi:hypothetical protein
MFYYQTSESDYASGSGVSLGTQKSVPL